MSEIITSTTPVSSDVAAMRATLAHIQDVLAGKFKPDELKAAIAARDSEIRDLENKQLADKAKLHNHYKLAQLAIPEYSAHINDEELYEKLKIVLPATGGLSGKAIATFVGDHRITAERIRDFQQDTFLLKRTGDHSTDNAYWLATPEETAAMKAEAVKAAEAVEAAEAAAKAAEKQAVRATKAKSTKKSGRK